MADIQAILKEDKYNKAYGKQRMYEKLIYDYECEFSYNTVAKVMRENGLLQGKNRPKGLTKADKNAQKADDLLKRNFTSTSPLEKVVTDITEFSALDGKLYLSAVFDCFDSSCLGLSMAENMKTELVIDSYNDVLKRYSLNDCISHSDRGSQYTSDKFKSFLKDNSIIQSMNSAGGRCHDNAKCESMWARAKVEICKIYDIKLLSVSKLKRIIADYFMDYWNNRRICSSIGGLPPLIKREAFYLRRLDNAA